MMRVKAQLAHRRRAPFAGGYELLDAGFSDFYGMKWVGKCTGAIDLQEMMCVLRGALCCGHRTRIE